MELDYQSQPNVDLSKQLNKLDKLSSRLTLTLKDIPIQQIIPQRIKNKIINCISKDYPQTLLKTLEKQVISWNREIGAKGTCWNVVHLCAKNNAVQCCKVLLKQIYQLEVDQYLSAVNAQTTEGLTPLMISIIYQSDKVLELLLHYGGIDLSKIEKGKLRAYDLALHYRNEHAISQLIVYQDRCKKRDYLNEQQLQKEEPAIEQSLNCYNSMFSYLFDCFICFKAQDEEEDKAFTGINLFKSKNNNLDTVKVGSRKDIQDYQIQWKKLSSISGQKIALFDSFKPQDICENQFTLKNNLILIQTLSDFPWLLRKVIVKIQTDQELPLKYLVNLYHNGTLKRIEVDQCVPTIRERSQPMFVSNRSEVWPMVLQKALAKVFGSYLSLNTLPPVEALQTISGFYTKQIPLSQIQGENGSGLISSLQQLSLKGYMLLLQARPRTNLNQGSQTTSYSILNFYQKGKIKKLLISCPNLVQNWKQPEIRQLTILKTHFSRLHQSCLWVDQQKLDYYFSHIVVVFLKQGYNRVDLKTKFKIKPEVQRSLKNIDQKSVFPVANNPSCQKQYSKSFFFKFKVAKQREESILLQITDLQTRNRYDLSNLQGWKNQGQANLIKQQEYHLCPQLISFQCIPGQYICKFDLKTSKLYQQQHSNEQAKGIMKKKESEQQNAECKKKVKLNLGPQHLQDIQLSVWGIDPLQLQIVEQQFGTIEWLSNFRTFSNRHWQHLSKQKQIYLTQTVNNKSIVVVKKMKNKKILIGLDQYPSEVVVQGNWTTYKGKNFVSLLTEQDQSCAYCVLSGVQHQTLTDLQVQFID